MKTHNEVTDASVSTKRGTMKDTPSLEERADMVALNYENAADGSESLKSRILEALTQACEPLLKEIEELKKENTKLNRVIDDLNEELIP
jgi:hypothetical protein